MKIQNSTKNQNSTEKSEFYKKLRSLQNSEFYQKLKILQKLKIHEKSIKIIITWHSAKYGYLCCDNE